MSKSFLPGGASVSPGSSVRIQIRWFLTNNNPDDAGGSKMSNCPKCGSKNTEWTDCKTVGDKTVVACICNDCKHTWEQNL